MRKIIFNKRKKRRSPQNKNKTKQNSPSFLQNYLLRILFRALLQDLMGLTIIIEVFVFSNKLGGPPQYDLYHLLFASHTIAPKSVLCKMKPEKSQNYWKLLGNCTCVWLFHVRKETRVLDCD